MISLGRPYQYILMPQTNLLSWLIYSGFLGMWSSISRSTKHRECYCYRRWPNIHWYLSTNITKFGKCPDGARKFRMCERFRRNNPVFWATNLDLKMINLYWKSSKFVFRKALYICQHPIIVNAPIEECPVCILPFSTQRPTQSSKEKHILRNVTSCIFILTIYLYFTSS